MTAQGTHPNIQAVRRVYENEQPTSSTPAGIIYLVCHPDASSGRDVLLWDDVLVAFKEDVIHIRYGAIVLPFLKGPYFKKYILDPLRIAAVPGATLDVVVRGRPGEKELSLKSLQMALPGAHQQGVHNNAAPAFNAPAVPTVKRNPVGGLVETAWENYMYIDDTPPTAPSIIPSTVRRNPAGGLVEEAMDAYRNNGHPAFGPRLRGPQAVLDNPLPSTASDSLPTSQKLISSLQTVASQESGPDINKDFDDTMEEARRGDKEAQFVLGNMYYDARGVPQDYCTAMDWYLKAAEQGSARAQKRIGLIHYHAQGVPRDYNVAMDWFLKSANQGDASAQFNIGHMHGKGLGVPQDHSSAMDWYLKAAYQGHAVAQNNIGWLYQHGRGVPRDYFKAMMWYREAADQGNALAQNNVAWMYEQGMGVSKDRAKAIDWYTKAVAGGYVDSMESLDRLEKQNRHSRGQFGRIFNLHE